jgi:hypothetical protein
MNHKSNPINRGMALAYVLVFLLVLVVLGFALGSSGIFSLSRSLKIQDSTSALYAAQAGIANEINAIRQNQLTPPVLPAGSTYSLPQQNLQNNSEITNQQIIANYNPSCTAPITAPDGTVVPCGMAYLSAEGSLNQSQRSIQEMAQVEYFDFSFFSTCLSCATTFPAHINIGTYQDPFCGGTGVVSPGGVLGTNSSSTPAISFQGGTPTNISQVVVGPGGTVSPSSEPSNNLSSPYVFPPPVDPLGGPGTINVLNGGPLSPGLYGTVNVSGGLTLNCSTTGPNTFSISSLTDSGGGNITLGANCTTSNPAILYVYNTLDLSGTPDVNPSPKPPTDLIIYGMSSLSATLNGTGSGNFIFYAPQASVTIKGGGSGTINGALIAKQIIVNGSGNAQYNFDQCIEGDSNSPTHNLPSMVFSKSWFSK